MVIGDLKIPLGGEIIIGRFIIDISYEELLGLTKTKSDSFNFFISSLQMEGIQHTIKSFQLFS